MTETEYQNGVDGPEADGFASAYRSSIEGLQRALAEGVTATAEEPSRPLPLARSLALDKNLGWKIARLISSEDPAAALRFVPGVAGLRKVRDSIAARCDADVAARLDVAIQRFGDMLQTHAGDRASLELLVQGLEDCSCDPETLEQPRRQAFVGNSAIWGVQARVQYAAKILAPSADDPDWADVCSLGRLIDFRRLRGSTPWLLFSSQSYDLDDGAAHPPLDEPLDPDAAARAGAPLLAEFCSDPLPTIDVRDEGDERHFVLPPGPIGNLGAMTCAYGTIQRKAGPRAMTTPDPRVEIGVNLLTPAETLQFDVLVHEGLGWGDDLRLEMLGRIEGRPPLRADEREGRRIPIAETPTDLGTGLDRLVEADAAGGRALVAGAFEQLGWDPSAFRAWRVTLAYPPMPATCMVSLPLPSA